jgi:acyl-CoA synthetase (AMP-forming)/AMP-acid ligase II
VDAEGYIFITGRIKELINKAGEKISPIELDNLFALHPCVSEAVSFAVADDLYGQDVGVAVVLKDGKDLAEDELREWLDGKVAKFKYPKKVCCPVMAFRCSQSCRSISLNLCLRRQRAKFNGRMSRKRCVRARR